MKLFSKHKVSFEKFFKTATSLLVPMLVVAAIAQAGSLSPSASPAATSYTLSNIYARLTTNASATAGNHSFNATTTPTSTFQTLADIYNAIPTIYASDFLATSTYLGVTGTIAVKSGDAAASAFATSTNKLLLTPAAGYYNGSTATVSTTSISFSFMASNIKNGTYLFGIVGTFLGDYTYGDSDASKVLTTAIGAGTYNAASLSTATVKKARLSASLPLACIPDMLEQAGPAPPSLKPLVTRKIPLGTGSRTAMATETPPTLKTAYVSVRLLSLPARGTARSR